MYCIYCGRKQFAEITQAGSVGGQNGYDNGYHAKEMPAANSKKTNAAIAMIAVLSVGIAEFLGLIFGMEDTAEADTPAQTTSSQAESYSVAETAVPDESEEAEVSSAAPVEEVDDRSGWNFVFMI